MKILLVAFACGPGQGSEPGVGWKTTRLLSQHHRLVVLTSPRHREAIERMRAAKEIPESTMFVFLGRSSPYHPNRMVARWQSWLEYLHWLKLASRETPRLCRDFQIDLVHHLTITTWRLPPVQVLSGTPLLWGPLGGAAHYPWHLLGGMSLGAAVFELLRNTTNQILIHQPFLKEACRRSSAILGSSQESVDWIKKLGGQSTPVTKLSATFFPEGKLEEFQALLARRRMDAPLRAFAGGNLIGSKGVGFALRALKLAKERGVVIPYTVASFGPEKSFLEALAERLGIRDQVVFHPGFTGPEYSKALLEHSIYLLPSFREGSPGTILEAMLAGQVPVVVKASAQGEIVDAQCGFAVEVGSTEKICSGLADALVALAADVSRREALARSAHEKAFHEYGEGMFLKRLEAAYAAALSSRPGNEIRP